MSERTYELGLDSFIAVTAGADGTAATGDQAIRDTVEEGVLAEQVGIDSFNIGEHYRDDMMDSAAHVVLAAIAGSHTLSISDFPAAPLDPPDAPRRRMVITETDGVAATGAPLPLLRNWLSGQKAPFAPTEVRPVGAGLVVGFPTPSPGGLLPE